MQAAKQAFLDSILKAGEKYAGLILGDIGEPDYHLILIPEKCGRNDWKFAKSWAEAMGAFLPTRREQSLLFANLKKEFETEWYWSGELHASHSDCAWCQDFTNGNQNYDYIGRWASTAAGKYVNSSEFRDTWGLSESPVRQSGTK